MRKATNKDIRKILEILTESFKENKSTNYVLKHKNLLPELFEYSIGKGFLFGDIWINDSENACAILIDPKKKKFNLKSTWLDLKLVLKVIGFRRVKKVLKKETITEQTLPKDLDYIHLWFLGVSPNVQGKGIGTELLKAVIEHYRKSKKGMCLETSTLKNLPFYEREGFKVYSTKDFGFKLYFYKKIYY